MEAKAIMLANPCTYKFLKGLTHSAVTQRGQVESHHRPHQRRQNPKGLSPIFHLCLKPCSDIPGPPSSAMDIARAHINISSSSRVLSCRSIHPSFTEISNQQSHFNTVCTQRQSLSISCCSKTVCLSISCILHFNTN